MSAPDREEALRRPYALPADVRILPVEELADHVRDSIGAVPGDFALSRPGFRTPSRVIDGDTVALLEQFREPRPLAEGIVRFARERGLDAQAVLRHAFPVLQSFTASLVLVPGDSEFLAGVEASFVPGQVALGVEIVRTVQVLQDAEVYEARAGDGARVALKVARREAVATARSMMEREAAILRRLGGVGAPALAAADLDADPPFLVMEWLDGASLNARARELRAGTPEGWRARLHRLGVGVAEAYAALHARGVVHGDPHPRNLLVDDGDRVAVLDFGLGRVLEPGSPWDHAHRAGFGWHTEPEAAVSLVRTGVGPPASPAGEQFAVASVIYAALAGVHYTGSPPTRPGLLERVLGAPPLPFARHGIEGWPAVEGVLGRALAKDPADRFPSTADFAAALAEARPGRAGRGRPARHERSAHEAALAAVLREAGEPGRPVASLFPAPPTASVQYGAAGLAWALYRMSQVRDAPRLLAAADQWSRAARARAGGDDAFEAPDVGVTRERVGPGCLYHRAPGVDLVHALVSHARGDLAGVVEGLEAFRAGLQADGHPELALGRSGVLVGGALLLEALRAEGRLDAADLGADLAAAADRVWADGEASRASPAAPGHLGVAHGLAGELYAQLRARTAVGSALPPGVLEGLERLADVARPAGRGLSWPGTLPRDAGGPTTPDHAPGWCAGTAGYVHLWVAAHAATGEARFLALAEGAAWHAWDHGDRIGQLCCGLAGRAFGLLRLYGYTGETGWLERAEGLVTRAAPWLDETLRSGDRPFGLFRGALGPVLAAVELDRPELAAMPLFASEGWPGPGAASMDPPPAGGPTDRRDPAG